MIWQDMVFTVGGFLLTVLLLPTLFNEDAAVPLKTSLPTGGVLYAYAYTMFTLGLYGSALMNFVTAAIWTLIALLRRPGDS